jgi:hypothetical protein
MILVSFVDLSIGEPHLGHSIKSQKQIQYLEDTMDYNKKLV